MEILFFVVICFAGTSLIATADETCVSRYIGTIGECFSDDFLNNDLIQPNYLEPLITLDNSEIRSILYCSAAYARFIEKNKGCRSPARTNLFNVGLKLCFGMFRAVQIIHYFNNIFTEYDNEAEIKKEASLELAQSIGDVFCYIFGSNKCLSKILSLKNC